MSSSLNVSLTDELRKYIDERASDTDLYATPSEYIRDLIRQDMGAHQVITHVMNGLNDLKNGNFSENSILDISNEP
jgi:antitoxin ParD1/3/4